ncbi:MAG TPA: hypothetical protein PKA03_15535 [Tabrizicola sp.]|nr:hypothetical protein [Tabrizicola sp.]
MRRSLALALLPLALAARPAMAEPPRISLIFGTDRLTAVPEDIHSVRRVDKSGRGAALVIRLVPGFDTQMRALTLAHVGETGQLLICGTLAVEPYLNQPIYEAVFIISDTDIDRIDQLQALLTGPNCTDNPVS